MKADVIIPVYNASDITWRSLCQLFLFHSPKDYHVILVDDCSTDDTPLIGEWVKRNGGTYVRNETNLGTHGAWNEGAKHTKTDVFIFMNNDILVGPGVLGRLVETADTFGFSCPREVQRDQTAPSPSVFLKASPPGDRPLLDGRRLPAGVGYGSCFCVTRRAWGDGVDARMKLILADVDFIYRVADRGYTPSVATDVRVFHLGSQSRIRKYAGEPAGEIAQQHLDFAVFREKWAGHVDVLREHSENPDDEAEERHLQNRNRGAV